MGINPKSLAAYAASKKDDDDGDDHEDQEPAEPEDDEEPAEPEDDYATRYASLIPVLEDCFEDIVSAADELDSDTLTLLDEPMSDNEVEVFAEGFAEMERKLQKALREACAEMPIEHAIRLAEHLEEAGLIEDTERFSGWLYRAGEWLAGKAA